MARASFILALLLCSFSASAFAAEESEWTVGYAHHTEKDNPIPKDFAEKLEQDYKRATKDPKDEHERPLVRHLLIVNSELTQPKIRALRGPTRILTPPGGGAIDLADYVTPLKGVFYLKIKLENDRHEIQTASRVYFISQSKQRKIGEEQYGAGCGKYFDVTSQFKARMAKNGFELFTADQRYVPVLRGTFVFVSYAEDALQLASLTFYDSRYTAWDCPQPEVM